MGGVIGTPITVDTVRASGQYPEPITQKNCADYALKMISEGGRETDAVIFVERLKAKYGNGITTKCLIFNATGTTINLGGFHDWHGHVYESPDLYPAALHNGQWGAFIHVHPSGAATGSAGAVVYRSEAPSCDLMFAWSVPYSGANTVYTEIREQGHFPAQWEYIYHEKLEKSTLHSVDEKSGYRSETSIANGTTVEARAIFTYP